MSGFITGLIITRPTPSSSSSSAASALSTAEPRQRTLLVWLPLRHQQSPTPDTNISSALLIPARTRRESSPWPPWPPRWGGCHHKNDWFIKEMTPPPTKAWFIKHCGVEPPLILLTKGKLSWLRPAFVIKSCKTHKGYNKIKPNLPYKHSSIPFPSARSFQVESNIEQIYTPEN